MDCPTMCWARQAVQLVVNYHTHIYRSMLSRSRVPAAVYSETNQMQLRAYAA